MRVGGIGDDLKIEDGVECDLMIMGFPLGEMNMVVMDG